MGLLLADNGSKSSPMYITGAADTALSDALRETLTKAVNDAKAEFMAAKGIKAA